MSQRTINRIAITLLVVISISQFVLKLGENKSMYRYIFMYLTVISRVMFAGKLYGYPSENYMLIEAVGFGMSMLLFVNFNISETFVFNFWNMGIVTALEALILLAFQVESQYVYVIKEKEEI